MRAFTEDVGSIERALRRLRARGQRSGGAWGARALAAFGVPGAAEARARWMGAYHSRFTDLPLPLAVDLIRLWDRPPVSESAPARVWLAIAHATCALRAADPMAARGHHRRARASFALAPPEARVELLLAEAFVRSHDAPERAASILEEVGPILALPMPAYDRACLHARWIDQRAYGQNRRGAAGDLATAEALYLSIPEESAPPFAACRRANGLAYVRSKQGRRDEAVASARSAVRHAGDGGHLRLRAMALAMLGRALGGAEGETARARAAEIVASLEDEALRLRFEVAPLSPRAS